MSGFEHSILKYSTNVKMRIGQEQLINIKVSSYIYKEEHQHLSIQNNYALFTNFQARYLYGNKSKSGMKILHWNKSSSLLNKT